MAPVVGAGEKREKSPSGLDGVSCVSFGPEWFVPLYPPQKGRAVNRMWSI